MLTRRLIILSLTLLFGITAVIFVLINTAVAISNGQTNSPEVGDYLLIKKYPDQQTIQRGEPAQFSIIVSNIDSSVNLTGIAVVDLLAPDCSRTIGNLPANSNFPTYLCTLDSVQEPLINWAAVQGTNPVNDQIDRARDSARVDIIDISVSLEAEPSSMPPPGGSIKFTVHISNTGSVTVALRSLTSPQFGDLTNPTNQLVSDNRCLPDPNLPLLLPNGDAVSCSFYSEIIGDTSQYPAEVIAWAMDKEQNSVVNSGTTTIDITAPVIHKTFIPLTLDMLNEPNDSCSNAYPLGINQPYHFMPDDLDDWYYFDLDKQGNVLVELTNFVPKLGQIVIYNGGRCNTLQVLKNNGNDLESKPVPLGLQPPGRYHVLVVNAGEPNVLEPYKLQIHFQEE